MKYLIEDNKEIEENKIISYFKEQLSKTDLCKENIIIDKSLRKKIGTIELLNILNDNGCNCHLISYSNVLSIELDTGHCVAFHKKEILGRFKDAYECILDDLLDERK